MACLAYVGLPGSGKSHGVVENVIIPALKKKQKVFTNIPLKNEYCQDNYGSTAVYFETKDLLDNPDWWTEVFEAGSLLVLDEAWRLWPAGLTINKARMQDKEFLAEHRHLVNQDTGTSTNIYIVTQNLSQISNFVKILVDKTFRSVKLDSVGAKNSFRVDIYQGEVSGANPPDTRKINSMFYKYKKEVFASYVSHTKSDIVGNEESPDDRFNFLKSTKFRILIFALLLPLGLVFVGKGFIEDDLASPLSSPDQSSSNPVVSSDNSNLVPVVSKPRFRFLSIQDEVYISYNNGFFPHLEYLITVTNGEQFSAVFDAAQLDLMGYSINPISTCAVHITGSDFNQIVLCSSGQGSKGFIENSVTETVM